MVNNLAFDPCLHGGAFFSPQEHPRKTLHPMCVHLLLASVYTAAKIGSRALSVRSRGPPLVHFSDSTQSRVASLALPDPSSDSVWAEGGPLCSGLVRGIYR